MKISSRSRKQKRRLIPKQIPPVDGKERILGYASVFRLPMMLFANATFMAYSSILLSEDSSSRQIEGRSLSTIRVASLRGIALMRASTRNPFMYAFSISFPISLPQEFLQGSISAFERTLIQKVYFLKELDIGKEMLRKGFI